MQRFVAFLLPFLSFCLVSESLAQNVSIVSPSISMYGYPWTALAGSDRTAYVMPVAETDAINAWSGSPGASGNNVVTFTANNHLSQGDVILIRNMTSSGQRGGVDSLPAEDRRRRLYRQGNVGDYPDRKSD
jgi:hypothetical protein